MRKFYLLFFAFLWQTSVSYAQFSGDYAPANWKLTTLSPSNGSVNTTGAPASIILTGSNAATATNNVNTDYTITTTLAGVWTFSWSYHSNDSFDDPEYDPAGVLINGTFTQLTDDDGTIDQTGTYRSAYLPAGTVIGFRIWAKDNVEGNATLTITNFVPPAASTLPVSLVSFTARQQGAQVKLAWQTASEENSDRFEVQRSANGRDYTLLATVAAQYNSTLTTDYTALDPAPLKGTGYYRLRMIDRDDSYKYSPVVTIKTAGPASLQLFPNPARQEVFLTLTGTTFGSQETIQVFDASGNWKLSKTVRVTPGARIPLDISGLASGVYFLKVGQDGTVQNFVKQ